MITLSPKTKSLLSLATPIIFMLLITLILQFTVLAHPEELAKWMKSFGPMLFVVYFTIQTIAIIFPPISAGAFQIALYALFGPLWGVILVNATLTPLYCVNFLISKKYGRRVVQKFVGEKGMQKVDDYAKDMGLGGLILLKVFQGNLFDFIAYGLGLTSISFKRFFWVNLLAGIPVDILTYLIFKSGSNFFISAAIFQMVTISLTVIYILYEHRRHKKQKI